MRPCPLLLLAAACGSGTIDAADGPTDDSGDPAVEDSVPATETDTGPTITCRAPGDHAGTVTVDGVEHAYRVHVPPTPAPGMPLVLLLHGGGSTGDALDATSGFTALADTEGFAVVIPEGWRIPDLDLQVWNAGACCGPRDAAPDHVAALTAVLDATLAADPCLDPAHVHAAGHSNGGMMAYRLGCEAPDRFASLAVSAGALMDRDLDVIPSVRLFDCLPSEPPALLHVHGLADDCVPFEGGPSARDATERPPVDDGIATWRGLLGCGETPTETAEGDAGRTTWPCRDGREVSLVTVRGLGHAWGGADAYPSQPTCGGTISSAVDTTQAAWDFFQRMGPRP